MKNKTHISSLLFVLLSCCTSLSIADALNFESSASNMIKKLSSPPIKLRSSLSSIGPKTEASAIELRGLTRIKLGAPDSSFITNNIIEERVTVPTKPTQAYVNLKIEFDINSYAIRPSSFTVLAELSKALQSSELTNKAFFINGHTDSDGEQNHNLRLSLKRAISIRQYLTTQGKVAPKRLTVIGYGENLPLVKNNNRYNKQINRRVEIVAQ